jgi:hypothetical protein
MSDMFSGMMEKMQDPSTAAKMSAEMNAIKDDPAFRPFVEAMEGNDPMKAMRFLQGVHLARCK